MLKGTLYIVYRASVCAPTLPADTVVVKGYPPDHYVCSIKKYSVPGFVIGHVNRVSLSQYLLLSRSSLPTTNCW